jgi:serine protease AprX
MQYFRTLFVPLMACVLVLAAVLPAAAAPIQLSSPVPAASKLHPVLQYGVQHDPLSVVRVIVQTVKPDTNASKIAADILGGSLVEQYKLVPAFVLQLPMGALPLLAADPGVRYVSPDGPVQVIPQLPVLAKGNKSHPNAPKAPDEHGTTVSPDKLVTTFPFDTGAPQAWSGAASGDDRSLTGANVAVAVVDSGIDATHPDLSSHVVAINVNRNAQTGADGYGHGTHVAGVIAGNDPSGQYLGIAPNATIISVKVTDDNGVAYESDLLRGLDWVSQNRAAYHIGVVNLSVTTGMPSSYATSPIDAAVEVLVHQNVTVVAAAGNLGNADDAVWYAPANDPLAITVGCIDDNQTVSTADDSLCPISSRGTTLDGLAKPDMVAPGRKILSTLASALNGQDVTLAQEFPDRITLDRRHIRLSGTSMAAPMVAGAVALLLQRQPGLSSEQIRQLLVGTTTTYPGQTDLAGSLNIPNALAGAQHPPKPTKLGPLPIGASAPPPGASTLVWDGSRWNTTTWDGSRWNTTTWDASRWNTSTWDGSRWNTATWDGSRWNSTTWDGSRWNTTTWDGSRWNSATWDGSRWNSSSWDGSRWNGASWDGSRWNSSSYD